MEFKDMAPQMEAFQKETLDKARAEWKTHHDQLISDGADPKEVKTMVDRAIKRLDAIEADWSRGNVGVTQQKSVGEFVAENEAFVNFSQKVKGGYVSGMRATIPVKSFSEFPDFAPGLEEKTTITSAAVGSATSGILIPDRMPGIVMPGIRKIRVRDLMPRGQTNNNAIEYVKENAFTNLTSPVAETISKPESALTFSIANVPVRTLASWIPAARQILDDFTQLQAYINQRLMQGLKDVEDYELVAGDGTGQHLSGLSTQAGAYDTARNVTGDTYIDQLNHVISQIEDVLLYADGIILHPRDWRKMQLIKDETGGANKGRYILGGPQAIAEQTIWGLPVATTTAVTRGTFYVGAFQRYAMVHDRMDARIDISTEHADFFIRNLVAIRCEERLALTIQRNDAVLYGSFA